jgi:hypothetical protein
MANAFAADLGGRTCFRLPITLQRPGSRPPVRRIWRDIFGAKAAAVAAMGATYHAYVPTQVNNLAPAGLGVHARAANKRATDSSRAGSIAAASA